MWCFFGVCMMGDGNCSDDESLELALTQLGIPASWQTWVLSQPRICVLLAVRHAYRLSTTKANKLLQTLSMR